MVEFGTERALIWQLFSVISCGGTWTKRKEKDSKNPI